MEPNDIIALGAGIAGFATGIAGLVISLRANGFAKKGNKLAAEANRVAAQATKDSRSTAQDAYRAEARGLMDEALTAANMAFTESGGEGSDERSPRTTLSVSSKSLARVLEYLDSDAERSALKELAATYRELSGLTARLDQARQRADNAAPEEYVGEASTRRLDMVNEATQQWTEGENKLIAAHESASATLSAGSRNEA